MCRQDLGGVPVAVRRRIGVGDPDIKNRTMEGGGSDGSISSNLLAVSNVVTTEELSVENVTTIETVCATTNIQLVSALWFIEA